MTNKCPACGEKMTHTESGFRLRPRPGRVAAGELYLRLACSNEGCAQAGVPVGVLGQDD